MKTLSFQSRLQSSIREQSAALLFLIAALLAFSFLTLSSAQAAALAGGSFVEVGGWKARITIDCLLKEKLCGSFKYETEGCEGDLIYTGESADGFEFRADLRAGRCLPGCKVQVSSDFKRYAEICKDGRHDGILTSAEQAAPNATSAVANPPSVTLVAPTVTRATNEEVAQIAAPAAPVAAPATGATTRVERTGDSTMKGTFSLDSKTGAVTGKVRIEWDNGNVFDGTMLNGQRSGKGKFTWANGQSYDGDWVKDIADGEGSLVFANGDRYKGQVRDGIPQGRGVEQFSNGDSYDGQFSNGIMDGDGTYTEKGGGRYTGRWKAGIKDGRGKQVWVEGGSYDGDWVANRPEGKGVFLFSNGDRYDGQMSAGLPNGKGRMNYGSQDVYEGDFLRGEAQGYGIYRWKNGDVYSGGWLNGKKSGAGRYSWGNGDYWEGEFADNKQTEAGRLYFTPALEASSAEVEKVAKQTNAVADASAGKPQAGKVADKGIDRVKLLTIPMVAKEMRECARKDGPDCSTQVVNAVMGDTLFPHKWQTMATEKDTKGKGPVFEVDTNSVLEGGNVFSWLRSGDGSLARNIGIKYDCRAQTLEIQLVYNCTGGQQNCALDPNIDKYAGKVIPATDIKNWFKGACDR